MNKLMQTVTENVAYVVIFLAVIVGCFLVAVVLEKSAHYDGGRIQHYRSLYINIALYRTCNSCADGSDVAGRKTLRHLR